MIIKNKKALSEMVSYVLIIVIAIGLSVGVYAWLKGYLPSQNPKEKCNSDVALIIEDYNCTININKLTIKVKNQGLFNVEGFFIRASNITNETINPVTPLNCTSDLAPFCRNPGQYDFITSPLKSQETKTITFLYNNAEPLKRIQIQPYTKPTKPNQKKSLLLCENIVNLRLEGCN